MSLLMDALRKAEEAKKKAAQKAKSEEAAAARDAENQKAAAAEEAEGASKTPDVELSMADIEEVPARSPASDFDTPIEFEDEEDYVLPSSVGASAESEKSVADNPSDNEDTSAEPPRYELQQKTDEPEPQTADDSVGEEASAAKDLDTVEAWTASALGASDRGDASDESDSVEEYQSPAPRVESTTESKIDAIAAGLDDLEETPEQDERPDTASVDDATPMDSSPLSSELDSLEDETADSEEEEEATGHQAVEVRAAYAESTRARVIVEREERTQQRLVAAGNKSPLARAEEPKRRTARNVFAAKKPPALSMKKMQLAAAGGLAVLLFFMGSYFYISINQESTFNLPPESYVATEFVDDGNAFDSEPEAEVESTVVPQTAVENAVTASVDASGTASLDVADDATTDVAALDEILAESEFPLVETAPEPATTAADIQPEILQQETPPLETIVTTIDDSPDIEPATVVATTTETTSAPEPEAIEDSVAISDSEPSAASVNEEPRNLISFRRQENSVAVDPNLDRAYSAYQQGALAEAEALYRSVLLDDPLQRDALLGLATITARGGNSAEALDLYSRLLARNPRDPIARAGLMELLPSASPASQEADIKRLLNEYPNVAALSYAHGNFLASNQRWSEAQQAYFRALQLAKADAAISGTVNPDYAFNLAVSLEHLNQREPARNYYREALEFAANHPAGFDLVAVRTRLASLAGSSSDE